MPRASRWRAPGRCYYMSTAVIRAAVEEWVERLRANPELGPEVERLLEDEKYRHERYRAARLANPAARRDTERAAVQWQQQDNDRQRLIDEVAARERQAGVDAGKVRLIKGERAPVRRPKA